MKRTFFLVFLCLLCSSAFLPAMAADAPAEAPLLPLALSTPAASCDSAEPASETLELRLPEPTPAASCTVSVRCRCNQVLSCTSASGNCQRVSGCSVTCDFNEQTCPPCNGFACL